jgi:pyridoxine/pyridoxamine 5'-phosphate oxidase
MWIKKKSRVKQGLTNQTANMTSQPLEEFEKFLHEATSSDTKKSIPNAAVIAADADGCYTFSLKHLISNR